MSGNVWSRRGGEDHREGRATIPQGETPYLTPRQIVADVDVLISMWIACNDERGDAVAKLAFDQDGVSFDWAPVEKICHHNRLSVDLFKNASEDNVAALIVAWYARHREAGGDPDPVTEEYLAEVKAENLAGLIVAPITTTNH
jgi:hypothetical protein